MISTHAFFAASEHARDTSLLDPARSPQRIWLELVGFGV